MNAVNFAIVGCGRVAIRHIEAIQAATQAQLIAVCDMNKDLAQDKASLGNVPFYTHYHAMLNDHPEIHVVIILTPSGAHFEHGMDILRHYHKHLVIEKPMVMTTAEAYQLKEEADRHHARLFPIYQNRFNKAVQRVKRGLQDTSELGQLRVGTVRLRWCRPQRYYDLSPWRGTWAMDGGALTNQGIHYIDLLRYLCGEVKRVHAKLATLGANIEVEDTAVAIIEFKSGALGVIEIMTSARPDDFEASISCVGDQGLAVISGLATNVLQTYTPDPSQEKSFSEVFLNAYGFGHNDMIQGIVDSLLLNKKPPVEFEDGLQTIKLLHALYKSDEINAWVNVDEAGDSSRLGVKNTGLQDLYKTPSTSVTIS